MHPAASIIRRLGGAAAVAAATGTALTAPYRWQYPRAKGGTGGVIPQRHHRALIDFAKNGFGDTQMFGLVARWPELLKRIASMFAYFLAGEAGLIEPRLLELTGFTGR